MRRHRHRRHLGPRPHTRAAFLEALAAGAQRHPPDDPGPRRLGPISQRRRSPGLSRRRVHFDDEDAGFLDRFAQFALIAAREAVSDSGLAFDPALAESTAIVTGSCVGGQTTEDEGFHGLYELKNSRFPPLTIPKAMANAGASRISLEYGITGPSTPFRPPARPPITPSDRRSGWCATASAEVAIAGGSEAPFSLGMLKAWEAMRVVSPDTCRPFSRDRQGLILGEGARHAGAGTPRTRPRARSPHLGRDRRLRHVLRRPSHHPTIAEGAARAMRAALLDAGSAPEAIGYINAHGTGTPANDPTEVEAIRDVFGPHADKLMVSSTKSMHGHALGAAGALEAAATLLALHEGSDSAHGELYGTRSRLRSGCGPQRRGPACRRMRALSNSFAIRRPRYEFVRIRRL